MTAPRPIAFASQIMSFVKHNANLRRIPLCGPMFDTPDYAAL